MCFVCDLYDIGLKGIFGISEDGCQVCALSIRVSILLASKEPKTLFVHGLHAPLMRVRPSQQSPACFRRLVRLHLRRTLINQYSRVGWSGPALLLLILLPGEGGVVRAVASDTGPGPRVCSCVVER